MNTAIAMRMIGADFLKLRKKLSTLIWSLVLALGPLLVFFIFRAVQHSSAPAEHPPAGGVGGYADALRLLAVFFGPLAAIMVGVDSGANDHAAGVFRDLVVTGRSRLALFAARVPAALAMTWIVIVCGYALTLVGAYAFAGGTPTPDGTLIANGLGFSLLSTGVICAVAVGFASLTTSRPAALTALIGWQLIASPILASISSLGSARRLLLSEAVAHFSPVELGDRGGHGASVTVSEGMGLLVLVIWLAAFLCLGAWRTRTMDA